MEHLRIHYFQHVAFEGLGCIEEWIKQKSHKLTSTKFYAPTFALPNMADIDVLIIMGGPMSVSDDDKYKWLTIEKAFIKDAIIAGKKVLGICLGAQLIAQSTGALVGTAPHKEIGWFKVKPTKNLVEIPWLYALLKDEPRVFHWHGDKFQIPETSANLVKSDANDNQMFLLHETALGIQFHLEVTESGLLQMIAHGKIELQPSLYTQTEEEILENKRHIEKNTTLMFQLLDSFLL